MMDDNAIDAMNLILEYLPTLAVRFGPPCNVCCVAGDSGLLEQLHQMADGGQSLGM